MAPLGLIRVSVPPCLNTYSRPITAKVEGFTREQVDSSKDDEIDQTFSSSEDVGAILPM